MARKSYIKGVSVILALVVINIFTVFTIAFSSDVKNNSADSNNQFSDMLIFSADDPTFAMGTAAGKKGDTVEIPLSIENNPGIIGAVLWFDFDDTVLAFRGYEDTGLLIGALHPPVYPRSPLTLSWMDLEGNKNNYENGIVVILTFEILDDENVLPGDYQIKNSDATVVSTGLEYISFEFVNGIVTVQEDVQPPVDVIGKIKTYNPKQETTVKLMQGDNTIYDMVTETESRSGQLEQFFRFYGVEPGLYTLVISKPGHTSFTVKNIDVSGEILDLTLDSRPEIQLMTLRCGDIRRDKLINDDDLTVLWSLENYNRRTDTAAESLCDLNGDGMINDLDLTILWMSYNYNKSEIVITY